MALIPVARSTLLRAAALFVAALLFAGGGWLWTRGHHGEVLTVESAPARARSSDEPMELPSEAPRRIRPEMSDVAKEQRRFDRTDADASAAIDRSEFLASRRKSFDKLDSDGDGKVSFDEYSARTVKKFAESDTNRDGRLSAAEFASTAPKHRAKPKPDCPPAEVERPEGEGQ